jgi:hypothetical protein
VRGPNFAAKRRAPQYEFAIPQPSVTAANVSQSKQVCQIGMTIGKLIDANRNRFAMTEVFLEERLQPGELDFFASSYHSRLIAN